MPDDNKSGWIIFRNHFPRLSAVVFLPRNSALNPFGAFGACFFSADDAEGKARGCTEKEKSDFNASFK
jgi:hypothetical protein